MFQEQAVESMGKARAHFLLQTMLWGLQYEENNELKPRTSEQASGQLLTLQSCLSTDSPPGKTQATERFLKVKPKARFFS